MYSYLSKIKALQRFPSPSSLLEKITSMSRGILCSKKQKCFTAAAILIISISFSLIPLGRFGVGQKAFLPAPSAPKVISPPELSDTQTYQGLPAGKIESFQTANAWGTVIFLPQFHKSPVSKAEDKINDIAEKNQLQTYQILTFLLDKFGPNLVMIEGNLYGEVPAEQIAKLANKIEKRNELVSSYNSLKTSFQSEDLDIDAETAFLQALDSEIKQVDREIILEGAPRKLKAEGKAITLFGAENESTYNQSREIYKDYTYLSDRLEELNHPFKKSSTLFLKDDTPETKTLPESLLKKKSQPNFAYLASKAAAAGKKELEGLILYTETIFYDLEKKVPKGIMVSPGKKDLLSQNNPYENTTNKSKLKKEISERKKDIEETVVGRRNKETAENFAKALKDKNLSWGVLQFGAGHKDGLVKELNKQGLTVIVLTPEEVLKRQTS